MPKDTIRSLNPLSETEERTLRFLLDRRGKNLPEAQQRREKERTVEAWLRARQDKMAREEAQLSRRLAQLHVDLDVISAEIFKIAPSGIAFRTVSGQLQKLAELVPTQSFF
jgi:hypothetical protein